MLDTHLEIWQLRAEGWKPTRNTLMVYATGATANEYIIKLANHLNYPLTDAGWTGKISFAVADAYWQGTRLQAKEVANGDPLSCGIDATVDGAYANLHGFTVASIPPGGWRIVLVKIVGTGLTFADVAELVTLTYPVD